MPLKSSALLVTVLQFAYQSHCIPTFPQLPYVFCILHETSRPQQYVHKTIDSVRRQNGDPIYLINITSLPKRERPLCERVVDVGCIAQQISLDYAVALEHCAQLGQAQWSILLEDDVEACEGAIDGIQGSLANLNAAHTMYAQFSKFTLATAFPTKNIPLFTRAVRDLVQEIPQDIVLTARQWGPGVRYVHHNNLFHHIGTISTIPERNTDEYLALWSDFRENKCGEPL